MSDNETCAPVMKCGRYLCAHPAYLPASSERDWQTGVCCFTAERCFSSKCCADLMVFSAVAVCPGVFGGAITDWALGGDCKWCFCGAICLPMWPMCGTAQMWRELNHRGVKPYPECVTSTAWFCCNYMCCASDFDRVSYNAAWAAYQESQQVEATLDGEEIVVQVEDMSGNVSTLTLLNSLHLSYLLQQLPFTNLSGVATDGEVELTFAETPLHAASTGAKDCLKDHGVETGATLRVRGAELLHGNFTVASPVTAPKPDPADFRLPEGDDACCGALFAAAAAARSAAGKQPKPGRACATNEDKKSEELGTEL